MAKPKKKKAVEEETAFKKLQETEPVLVHFDDSSTISKYSPAKVTSCWASQTLIDSLVQMINNLTHLEKNFEKDHRQIFVE